MKGSLLLLLACAEEEKSPPAAEERVESPSPYTYDAPEEQGAVYDALAVEQGLQDFFEGAYTLSAGLVIDAYTTAMSEADGSCPLWYEYEGSSLWYATCETSAESPASFEGYAFDNLYSCYPLFEDENLWNARVVQGAATIRTGGGDTMSLGGSLYSGEARDPSDCALACEGSCAEDCATVCESATDCEADCEASCECDCIFDCEDSLHGWVSGTAGGFAWSGEGAEWLAEGVSPALTMYAIRYVPAQANYAYLDGTVGGLSSAATGISVSDLTYADALFGFPCELEPAGTISVRDADANWWEVVFDVNPENWRETGPCDGCGTVMAGGEIVGEACIDPSALLDWEDRPW